MKINHKSIIAFTLIEILVVATIMGLLAGAGFISYRALATSGRDARRKVDLEQVRSAIEQYRSNNIYGSYPDADDLVINCNSTGGITDTNNTYLSKIPIDPSCPTYSYYYVPTASCDSAVSSTPCLDFTLGSFLENSTDASNCISGQCGANCRYCLGPYGEK